MVSKFFNSVTEEGSTALCSGGGGTADEEDEEEEEEDDDDDDKEEEKVDEVGFKSRGVTELTMAAGAGLPSSPLLVFLFGGSIQFNCVFVVLFCVVLCCFVLFCVVLCCFCSERNQT